MIELLLDSEAHSLVNDPGFARQWQALYDDCAWGTAFQAHAHMAAWYRAYADLAQPLVVRETTTGGSLAGLFCLAVMKDSGRLVAAGTHQAPYQVWLARADRGEGFFLDALDALAQRFPRQDLVLSHLPPGTPLDWAKGDGRWARLSVLEAALRPLVVIDEKSIKESLSKRGNRGRLNRLRRLGEMKFQKLGDRLSLESCFDQIIVLYDLRQGVIHGGTPFRNDPRKRPFHLDLMEAGLLHVTVMTIDDRVIAAQIGVCDGRTMYGGMICHSPFYASYSPGKMHLHLLTEMMAGEGFSCLDLTPGADSWKDRFATQSEPVHRLSVSFRYRDALCRKFGRRVKRAGYEAARSLSVEPCKARGLVRTLRRQGFRRLLTRQWARLRLRIHDRRELCLYACGAGEARKMAGPAVLSRDCLADLLAFEPVEAGQSQAEFFSHSFDRMSAGAHVYTRVENGRLVQLAWLSESPEAGLPAELQQAWEFPAGSAVICDGLCHAFASEGFCLSAIPQILADLASNEQVTRVWVCVPADRRADRETLWSLGFRHEESLVSRTFVGRTRIERKRYPRPDEPAPGDVPGDSSNRTGAECEEEAVVT